MNYSNHKLAAERPRRGLDFSSRGLIKRDVCTYITAIYARLPSSFCVYKKVRINKIISN